MFRRAALLLFALLLVAGAALEAAARNPAYYGTRRHTSARYYSGEYQATVPNVVPTFSLPVYGNAFRTYYRGGYYGAPYSPYGYVNGVYSAPAPVIVYPPAVFRGGF